MGGRNDEALRRDLDGGGDGENAGDEINDIWALSVLRILLETCEYGQFTPFGYVASD
jgi:hypothetical protein